MTDPVMPKNWTTAQDEFVDLRIVRRHPITLPAGWVAHTPYLAERTADHMIVVCEREEHYRYSGGLASGTGTKTAATLYDACVWLDEALSPSPWQQVDATQWKRSDGALVSQGAGGFWRVLHDDWMSAAYFINAEQARAWANKKRPL